MTRRQFIMSATLGFMGLTGVLRVLQEMNTPGYDPNDPDAFGYGDYGHPEQALHGQPVIDIPRPKQPAKKTPPISL